MGNKVHYMCDTLTEVDGSYCESVGLMDDEYCTVKKCGDIDRCNHGDRVLAPVTVVLVLATALIMVVM